MPDFTAHLNRPAGKAVKPPALPIETYPGIIKRYEYGDNNSNKTPYVRYHLGLTGWPSSIPQSQRSMLDADGQQVEIDLSKKQLRRDFYLTEDAYYRLDEFLRSCGINLEDRTYKETCPQVVGCPVLIDVQQYLNQNNNEIGNQVGGVRGMNGAT